MYLQRPNKIKLTGLYVDTLHIWSFSLCFPPLIQQHTSSKLEKNQSEFTIHFEQPIISSVRVPDTQMDIVKVNLADTTVVN